MNSPDNNNPNRPKSQGKNVKGGVYENGKYLKLKKVDPDKFPAEIGIHEVVEIYDGETNIIRPGEAGADSKMDVFKKIEQMAKKR